MFQTIIKIVNLLTHPHRSQFSLHYAYEYNQACYIEKNHRNNMWGYLRAALRGDTEAQYQLGLGYLNGEMGLDRSYVEAEKWLNMAASQGHSGAKQMLNHVLNQLSLS